MRVLLAMFLAACGGNGGGPDAGDDAAVADAGIDAGASDAATGDDASPDAGDEDAGVFTGPFLLSETGLYEDIASRALTPGIVPYRVRYELWADGADKQRYLLLPEGTQIDTSVIDHWRFPIGTRVFKEFRVGGVLVETRLLEKLGPERTDWLRIAYVWRADGSDADAAPLGMEDALGTEHDVPSSADCWQCHRGVMDDVIGVSAIQLTAAADGGGSELARLAAAGLLSDPPAADPEVPGDGVVEDALGYLHGNCGHCHSDEHPLAVHRTLRFRLLVGVTTPEETPTYLTAINAMAAHLIGDSYLIVVPGSPARSQLHVRMGLRDLNAMPPLATERPDDAARATIAAWITDL